MTKKNKNLLLQLGLFIVTLFTTTMSGVEWMYSKNLIVGMTWDDFYDGLHFSLPFLLFLTSHEFGHYLTARYYKIKTTLPYYIPLWFGGLSPSLGTMGAFIRIKEPIVSRLKYFDVGIAGPLAGFIIAFLAMIYGFLSLPETEYIYEIHPEYEVFGPLFEEKMAGLDTVILKSDLNSDRMAYAELPDTLRTERISVHFGDNLLLMAARTYLGPEDRYVPSDAEIMHYPLLLAAFLAFFFTALNLLPIGQLDGGHILFGLVGAKYHAIVSRIVFTVFLFYAGLGFVTIQHFREVGSTNFFMMLAAIIAINYISASSVFKDKQNRLLYAVCIVTAQFLLASFYDVTGYSGWLLFSIFIGRLVGVDHPPVIENEPLSLGRKILGWLSLLIFILCFSPQPIVLEGF